MLLDADANSFGPAMHPHFPIDVQVSDCGVVGVRLRGGAVFLDLVSGSRTMAKYTREQRRALELHTWYGRCVADVIRELGHTSRDALHMWHRGLARGTENRAVSARGDELSIRMRCFSRGDGSRSVYYLIHRG